MSSKFIDTEYPIIDGVPAPLPETLGKPSRGEIRTAEFQTSGDSDPADALIKRIKRIARGNGVTLQQAAWAVTYVDPDYQLVSLMPDDSPGYLESRQDDTDIGEFFIEQARLRNEKRRAAKI